MRKTFIFLFALSSLVLAKTPAYEELLELQEIKNSFPQDFVLKKTTSRPDNLSETYTSHEGHFKIHYTTSGTNAVDTECTNEDDVPDWIYLTAQIAEKAFHVLVDSIGFDEPPVDGVDGDEFDIYIKNLNGSNYAYTQPESEVTSTSRPNDYTSYLVVDNDLEESAYYTNGTDALKVTVAHEFFHTIQLGYNYNTDSYLTGIGDTFFFEWSSVWFEDFSYPDVNDYVNYAKSFSYYPSYYIWSSSYWYSHGIFMKYIIDNYGVKILKETWDKIKNNTRAYYALEKTIKEETDKNLPELYNEFCQSMYYSGTKYDENYAVSPDAQYFPDLSTNWNDRYEFDNLLEISSDVYQLATLPVLVSFNSSQKFGLLENDDFKSNFVGSYVFDDNKITQQGNFDLSTDYYIEKSSTNDTLIIFVTNKDEENISTFDLTIDYVEPTKFLSIGNVFPNPLDGNGSINLKVSGKKSDSELNITLYDLLGRKLMSKTQTDSLVQINLGSNIDYPLASGIYFLKVKTDDNEKVKKFTILK